MTSGNENQPQPEQPKGVQPSDAVQITRTVETLKTVRLAMLCLTIIVVAIVTAYVIIRIYTYDFWIELIILLFGPGGIVTAALAWFLRRLNRKVNSLQNRIPGAATVNLGESEQKP